MSKMKTYFSRHPDLLTVEARLTDLEVDREVTGKSRWPVGVANDLTTCSDLRPGDLFYATEFDLDGVFGYVLQVDRDVPSEGYQDLRYVFCRITFLHGDRVTHRTVPEGKEAFVPWR